ncbi:heme-binding protein soul2 [Gadus chalcogrammus]|uniref:heme-binding protein soul2 n=1 Tax=Gadus chalcogrammus TaxID=1042646 RepID=UPI0024C4811E|nr:heme-binding protein soul2 [Gadus chalcogrammus]
MEKGPTPGLWSALLILAMLSGIGSWVVPDFCRTSYECPEYTLLNQNADFEERLYVETLWMTAKVRSTSNTDLSEGFWKLDKFRKGNNVQGRTVPCKTWPAIITVRQGEDYGSEPEVSVSWFFVPGTQLPLPLDTSISMEVRPAGKVYVRIFSGTASQSKALATAVELGEMLTLAGKTFEAHRYTGAFYDSPWDILRVHHNEIWINAA